MDLCIDIWEYCTSGGRGSRSGVERQRRWWRCAQAGRHHVRSLERRHGVRPATPATEGRAGGARFAKPFAEDADYVIINGDPNKVMDTREPAWLFTGEK